MFENQGRTELSSLGEFRLIEHLSQFIQNQHPSTIFGIGDDAAVLEKNDTHFSLLSTDMLVEGTHFDLTYTPLMHLGYKSIVCNLSDIAAMNGTPTHLTVSIAISNRFSLEAIEEIYKGMIAASKQYKVDIIGGDTTSIAKGLVISIACYGEVEKNKVCYRSGASEGDLLLVTGDLGAAYLGLHILEREKRIFLEKPDFQPDLEGNDYLIQRQLKPEARIDLSGILAEADVQATSMIDISDGLSSEIHHLAKNSQLGFKIYEDKLPLDPVTYQRAVDLGIDPTVAVMNGGEDFEILFTVKQSDYEKVKQIPELSIIGHAVAANEGIHLISKAGNQHELPAQGWKNM